ncbi:TPA: 50S ribosomal protein L22 [bacterium]|nr:50S ribosomal protein L22 [bacterium]
MEAQATAKYLRISPSKLMQVIPLIKGKRGDVAENILQMTQKKASYLIHKTLASCFANLRMRSPLSELKDIRIKNIMVGPGPTMKRTIPISRGRANRILKRTAHLTVLIEKV